MPMQTLQRTTPRAPGHSPTAGSGSSGFLTMVCDATHRYLLSAEAAIHAGNGPFAAENILRAQSILVEMIGAVDRAVLPELAGACARVCQRLMDRLSLAMARQDAGEVRQVRWTLMRFRDAWAETQTPRTAARRQEGWRIRAANGAAEFPAPRPRQERLRGRSKG